MQKRWSMSITNQKGSFHSLTFKRWVQIEAAPNNLQGFFTFTFSSTLSVGKQSHLSGLKQKDRNRVEDVNSMALRFRRQNIKVFPSAAGLFSPCTCSSLPLFLFSLSLSLSYSLMNSSPARKIRPYLAGNDAISLSRYERQVWRWHRKLCAPWAWKKITKPDSRQAELPRLQWWPSLKTSISSTNRSLQNIHLLGNRKQNQNCVEIIVLWTFHPSLWMEVPSWVVAAIN